MSDAMEKALALLAAGEPVALPTETVYGLAADATSGEAVARIFEVKGRPRFNPLIAHVAGPEMAGEIARFDPLSQRLVDAFWPGPLTLVLPMREGARVHPLVTAGLETVALRMPREPACGIIARFGRPLAAPSANLSGRITPTDARAVAAELGERIGLVVDGGASPVGLESTIVKVADGRPILLRPGGLARSEIEAALGMPLTRPGDGGALLAPGMMVSHYAPDAPVRLDIARLRDGEALLAFGPRRVADADKAVAMRNLSATGDLREAAANLFAFMRELDRAGARAIAVEPIPDQGLGEAIRDRLARAAAPRPGNQA